MTPCVLTCHYIFIPSANEGLPHEGYHLHTIFHFWPHSLLSSILMLFYLQPV